MVDLLENLPFYISELMTIVSVIDSLHVMYILIDKDTNTKAQEAPK